MSTLVVSAAVLAWLGLPSLAHAQEDQPGSAGSPPASSAQRAADTGAFSAWNMTARSNTQRTVGRVIGGYDGAADKAVMDSIVEAKIADRAALRAGVSYLPTSDEFGLRVDAKLDALRQEAHGLDLAIAAGYQSTGFNEVPAVAANLAIGRSLGRLQLLGNVGYGVGLEEGEQYGNAGVAGLYRVTEDIQVGIDSRFRIDLERDADEPPGERDWDLMAGPQATATVGPLAVTVGGGMAANQLRLDPNVNVGALGYVGVGAAF
ncbi:MAG TPA: hypothetical protein VMG12_40685 [Polyangiaceae bacterium]|nr:hypothetical protein [Polyangiaceae bacterium]